RLHLWKRIQISYHRQSRLLGLSLILCIAAAIPAMAVYSDFILYQLLPMQRTYTAMGTAIDNMKAYHRLSEKMTSTVSLTRNESKIKNVIFILGESTNRNHMQLYGYYLPNSPHLMKLQEKGEIAVFKDIVSPHSTTIAVLSELFTFCDHESGKPWYEYNTLIDVMHAAGYKTFWLSNQESSGAWGNVAQIYANHSDYHKFTRIRDSLEDTGILDGELFPLIDESKALRSEDKNFFVVHLMGGHGLYYNRYPYEFNKFTGKDIKLNVSERFKEVVAQYDNALYYNDYVVDEIINRFRDDEAIVIYVPDHAEAVYDEGSVAGHIEENPNRHMIEIPMIVWASNKFKEKYPDKWEQVQDAVDRPYMTDDMIHTILDLTDIATEDYRSDKSLINEEFDASRPRIFNDLNYDTQIREKKL
ncbi:MAG: phosphoethanolamine transferase, partial [Schwartzia sp.]|nr:phosphoethanolamine transferase [Schwartzia sp. (in: firmicutes)]